MENSAKSMPKYKGLSRKWQRDSDGRGACRKLKICVRESGNLMQAFGGEPKARSTESTILLYIIFNTGILLVV